jgi:hypothetical protein
MRVPPNSSTSAATFLGLLFIVFCGLFLAGLFNTACMAAALLFDSPRAGWVAGMMAAWAIHALLYAASFASLYFGENVGRGTLLEPAAGISLAFVSGQVLIGSLLDDWAGNLVLFLWTLSSASALHHSQELLRCRVDRVAKLRAHHPKSLRKAG